MIPSPRPGGPGLHPGPQALAGRRRAGQKRPSAYLFILPTFAALIALKYYPAASAVYHSFFQWDGFTAPRFTGLANYVQLVRDSVIHVSAVNIVKFIIGRCLLNLIFPLLAAKMVFHVRRQGAAYLYRVLLTSPIVIPIMVTLLLWRFIYDPYDGLLNQLLQAVGLGHWRRAWLGDFETSLYAVIGLGFPWVTGIGNAGFAFLIYLGGLQSISREIFDAAAVDGATAARRFWRIELPMIAPQIKLILLLTIINTMESYVPVMVMTGGGPGVSSMVPGLYLYETAFSYDKFGYASAIGVAMTVVLLIVTWVSNRSIRTASEVSA